MRMNPHFQGSTQDGHDRFQKEARRLGTLLRIGNDIVDLEHPRCRDRSREDPLFERILTADERGGLESVAPDDLWPIRIWALWASKEAAFKVLCKLPGGPRSLRYRSFACRLELRRPSGSSLVQVEGTVQGPDDSAPVRIEGTSDERYLHVVAWNGRGGDLQGSRLEVGLEGAEPEEAPVSVEGMKDRFTDEEWEGIHSPASARVRLLARTRLRAHLGAGAGKVEILTSGRRPGRTPPRIRVDDRDRPDLDLSLSHHGRYVAWALLIPAGPAGRLDESSERAP